MQIDNICLKHFALLGNASLEVVAEMYAITDETGIIPQQTARIIMPMLPKKDKGYRLIGLFAAYTRLYNKTWADRVGKWEDRIDRPWMAAGKARQPSDVVYRAELKAEQARERKLAAACISLDISAFYETNRPQDPRGESDEPRFPHRPTAGGLAQLCGHPVHRLPLGHIGPSGDEARGDCRMYLCHFVGQSVLQAAGRRHDPEVER